MAIVCYLIAPTESPPRYGLDHEFDVESDEFLNTIAGATGVPFTGGNRIAILNNGDEFYPAMLRDVRAAEASVTIEAYIYWAGAIGLEATAVVTHLHTPIRRLLDFYPHLTRLRMFAHVGQGLLHDVQ